MTGNNSIVSVDATMLEHSEFALFRQKFEYDLALMEVYRFKVSSQSSLLYHHRLEHIKRRRMQASEAVDVMFQNGCPPRFAFCIANRPGNAVGSSRITPMKYFAQRTSAPTRHSRLWWW